MSAPASATPVPNELVRVPAVAALVPMLTRLKLTAIRDQLDTLMQVHPSSRGS